MPISLMALKTPSLAMPVPLKIIQTCSSQYVFASVRIDFVSTSAAYGVLFLDHLKF